MYLGWAAKPVKFYPYESCVTGVFFRQDGYDSGMCELRQELLLEFGVKDDNKIVFEIEVNGQHLFIGFKDGRFAIGTGVNCY